MAFAGFDKKALGFFDELAKNMNRDWFAENKERYEETWVAPMKALLDDVRAKLATTYKPVSLDEPKVMRIYRDVRFSKNKRPYKTHIGAAITLEGRKIGEGGTVALYVHLGQDEQFVGTGCYQFDGEKMARWRSAVGDKRGAALAKIVDTLRADGYEVGGHDDFKRVPRGFSEDHPRAALLKLKGLTVGLPSIPKGMLQQAAFAGWCVEHAKKSAPLVKWLHQHVG